MIRQLCLFLMALFLLSLLLAGCERQAPVRVGFLGGLSGRVADLGVSGRNGVMLAVEQVNQAGGLHGQPVELLVRDDAQNPVTARQAVDELLSQQVDVIIGPMTSSMAMAIYPVIENGTTLVISPTVTTTQLTGKDDLFMRVIADTHQYAGKNARYQFQKLGYRKIAAIYDIGNQAYSESWLHDFTREFTGLGGEMVRTLIFRSGADNTFSQMIPELLQSRPDCVLVIANSVDAALICQQIRHLAPQMPISLSEWASTERFIELGGTATDGIIVAQFLERSDTSPRYQEFLASYRHRFNQDPGFAGLAGYDAMQVAIAGIRGRQPGESLKHAIIRLQHFQGAQQQITIDAAGDSDRRTFITEIRNGQFLTLE